VAAGFAAGLEEVLKDEAFLAVVDSRDLLCFMADNGQQFSERMRRELRPNLVKACNKLKLKYQSGEEVRKGDRVLFMDQPGEIELAVNRMDDPETDWHMENNGPGILVRELEPKAYGRVYLSYPEEDEDLIFVSRAESG
jgi:hypothetical protein